jgi:hypothetical protein
MPLALKICREPGDDYCADVLLTVYFGREDHEICLPNFPFA